MFYPNAWCPCGDIEWEFHLEQEIREALEKPLVVDPYRAFRKTLEHAGKFATSLWFRQVISFGYGRTIEMQIKWPVLVLMLVLMGLAFFAFYPRIENFFVFFPDRSHDHTPEDYKLNFKDIYFESGDGNDLHGWLFSAPEKGPVLLFCHGNAGNISHRLENIRLLVDRGLQVFIFDYRGYGRSSGRPSEAGIYRDGLAAYDHLVQRLGISRGDIIAFGRSLGAAVALEIALQRKVRCLVMESAFTSTKGMAGTMFVFGLLAPFLPAHYANLDKIPRLMVPKLIIHGREDKIVPFAMGKKLFESASRPKLFYPMDGAGHNDTYIVGGRVYFDHIESFVRQDNLK